MKTIFSLVNPQNQVTKGVVEIFQTYDGNYYSLALDGKIIEECYKTSYELTLLSRKFIRECCKVSGKTEEELIFVLYDFYDFGNDVVQDYDANDYEAYKDMYSLVKTHVKTPDDIKKFKAKYVRYEFDGIDELEDNIS